MSVIAWLEYELAYYDFAVHRFNHYNTRTSPLCKMSFIQCINNANNNQLLIFCYFTEICILNLDQAVNQIFSIKNAPVKISGRRHMLNGNPGRYEMIYVHTHMRVWVVVTVCHCQLTAVSREPWPQGAKRLPCEVGLNTSRQESKHKVLKITYIAHCGPPVEYPQPKSRIGAKFIP